MRAGRITKPAPPANERPRCSCCGKTLTPIYINGEWSGQYDTRYKNFCTLSCGLIFANAVIDSRKFGKPGEKP